jgi:hypothetical protein
VNGNLESTPALRGCDTIDRYCDAGEGQPSADTVKKLGTWAEVTLRVKH